MTKRGGGGVSLFFFGGGKEVVDPLSYFSVQPMLHDWCNKGYGMYYLV